MAAAVTVEGLDPLEEAMLVLAELLAEAKKKREWEMATRINEVIGKLEAARREKKRLLARLRLLEGQRSLPPGLAPSLAPAL